MLFFRCMFRNSGALLKDLSEGSLILRRELDSCLLKVHQCGCGLFRFKRKKTYKKKKASSVTRHYLENKEMARELVLARLNHFNQYYNLNYRRVAIRNQRRRWGSCSSLKNLNFNYKILLLPPHLQDYIVVHELCHLQELNHGKNFWSLVSEQIPEYKVCVTELGLIDKNGHSVQHLLRIQKSYFE